MPLTPEQIAEWTAMCVELARLLHAPPLSGDAARGMYVTGRLVSAVPLLLSEREEMQRRIDVQAERDKSICWQRDDALRRLGNCEKRADEALSLLREVEWKGQDGECPVCGGCKPSDAFYARSPIAVVDGHVAGCRLDASAAHALTLHPGAEMREPCPSAPSAHALPLAVVS